MLICVVDNVNFYHIARTQISVIGMQRFSTSLLLTLFQVDARLRSQTRKRRSYEHSVPNLIALPYDCGWNGCFYRLLWWERGGKKERRKKHEILFVLGSWQILHEPLGALKQPQ